MVRRSLLKVWSMVVLNAVRFISTGRVSIYGKYQTHQTYQVVFFSLYYASGYHQDAVLVTSC